MRINLIGILLATFFASGCATLLNPYESEKQCPETFNGKCASLEESYLESFRRSDEAWAKVESYPETWDEDEKPDKASKQNSQAEQYANTLFGEMTKLIKQPETPIVAPPKVMRVLILPYSADENERNLYMERWVYILLDGPRWTLGEYLFKEEN